MLRKQTHEEKPILGSRYSYTPEEINNSPQIKSMIQGFIEKDNAYIKLEITFKEIIRRVSEEGRMIRLGYDNGSWSILILSQLNRETCLKMEEPPALQLRYKEIKDGSSTCVILTPVKPLDEHIAIWHKLKEEQAAQQNANLAIEEDSVAEKAGVAEEVVGPIEAMVGRVPEPLGDQSSHAVEPGSVHLFV